MNLLKTLLIGSLIVFAGCVKDDMKDCPYNAMLTFRYYGDESSDQFSKMINGVTLYVFSKEGQLVTTQELSTSSLRAYQGVNLKLEPGQYRFVCWGNAGSETAFTEEQLFSTALLQHPDLSGENKVRTNDHLYFGTYEMDLPKNDIIAGEVLFAGAHINLEIYTKGSGTNTQLPGVEVQNLFGQYDFTMSATDQKVTYYPEMSYDAQKNAAVAKLQVLRFPEDNSVKIDIKSPQNRGESITVIDMKKFLAENKIQITGMHEITISVLVEFYDLGINITVPDWKKEDIDPVGPGYN